MDEARCDVTYGFLLLALHNIQVPENLANRARQTKSVIQSY